MKCKDKKLFFTKDEAEGWLQENKQTIEQHAYRCPVCKFWHLTTGKDGKLKKAVAKAKSINHAGQLSEHSKAKDKRARRLQEKSRRKPNQPD